MQKTARKFLYLLLSVCAMICIALGIVACGEDDDPSDPADGKVTYSVTVTAPGEITLTTVKAQWMKGTTAASSEIALDADGKASVELAGDSYTVTLKGVPSGYTFTDASVTATSRSATIEITEETPPPVKVTYTVTVTAPQDAQIDFTEITAQWKSGTEVVESDTLDAKGEASVELYEGNYTVTLDGVPAGYTFADDNVTAVDHDAEIALTAIPKATYTVTVTAPQDAEIDFTEITAQWKQGTTVVESQALSADGTASVELYKGDYTVTLSGVPTGYTFADDNVTATDLDAAISITAIPKATYTVTVTVPQGSGIDLTEITVQWKQGTKVIESEKLSVDGEASVTIYEGDYTVTLTGVPTGYTFEDDNVTATDLAANIAITLDPAYAIYTVTVTATDSNIVLENITVKWTQMGQSIQSAKLSADGTASALLHIAYYDLVLEGLPSEYTYTEGVYVDQTTFSATIEITKLPTETYVITVDIGDYSFTQADFQVQLKANGELVGEPKQPNGNWEVEFEAIAGDYEVVLVGDLPGDYNYMVTELLTQDNLATTLKIGLAAKSGSGSENSPYVLSATGYYVLTGGVEKEGSTYEAQRVYIRFTAPEAGTYSFDLTDNYYWASFYEAAGREQINSDWTVVVYTLEAGGTAEFDIMPSKGDYTYEHKAGDLIPFSLIVTTGNKLYDPDEGKTLEKAKKAVEGANQIDDIYEGYFELPLVYGEQKLLITVGGSYQAYFLATKNAEELNWVTLDKNLFDEELETIEWETSYLRIVNEQQEEHNVKFWLTIESGSSSEGGEITPIEAGQTVSYYFSGWDPAWFSFTPEETGTYKIFPGQNFQYATVYTEIEDGLEGKPSGVGGSEVGEYTDILNLTQGTTYYIELGCQWGLTVTFSIAKYTPSQGDTKSMPIEISGTVTNQSITTAASGDYKYFVYTATASGVLKFRISASASGTEATLFKTADFSYEAYYGWDYGSYDDGYDYFRPLDYSGNGEPVSFDIVVSAGDKIYIEITNYDGGDAIFSIVVE